MAVFVHQSKIRALAVLALFVGVGATACGDGTAAAPPVTDTGVTLGDTALGPVDSAVPPPDVIPFVDGLRPDARPATDALTGPEAGRMADAAGDAGVDGGGDLGVECIGPEDCSDGEFCNGAERCQAGHCLPAPHPPCADNVECTVNLCDEDHETCERHVDDSLCPPGLVCDEKVGCFARLGCADDADCDDGLPCNGVETCVDRLCQPGTPVVCEDAVDCTHDVCNDSTGDCEEIPDHSECQPGELCSRIDGCEPRPPCVRDDDCDDAIFCNGQETCEVATGLCHGGEAPTVDDGVDCTLDACSEAAGVVTHTPRNNRCSDGLFCNGNEICHPVEGCQPGAPPPVNDGIACTQDRCDEDADFVEHTPDDATCDDGLFCNGAETCNAEMDCQPGEPPLVNDHVNCTLDACSEVERAVIHRPDDSLCDDTIFCNGAEICDPVGGCRAGAGVALDDGFDCTDDTCVEAQHEIRHTPVDLRCDNGLFCDGEEVCVPELGCLDGPPVRLDDAIACTDDTCSEAQRSVVHTPVNARCDNGVACDGLEICDAAAGCEPGPNAPVDDHVACTVDTCDPVTGAIAHVPHDALCADALFCNGAETCDAVRGCQPGVPPVLDDGVGCTQDTCDEATRGVVHTPIAARCDDALFCNGAETCDRVAGCRAGVPPVLSDGVNCTSDACDEANDRIVHSPDNARCGDGNVCNGDETCDAIAGCRPGNRAVDGTVCLANPRDICLAGICAASRCGDRYVDAGRNPAETCDEGNVNNGDGCSAACQTEGGGVPPYYTGRFGLVPSLVYQCVDILFGSTVVNFNTSQIVISVAGNTLSISGLPVVMTQTPPPNGPNFSATGVIAGGCTETYTLAGAFTDNDHWCGVFTASFTGGDCGFSTCVNQSVNVCGTRAP